MIIEPPKDATELKACCDIWLAASKNGHSFINGDFWQERYDDMLCSYLPRSQVHIAHINEKPAGFSATSENTLEALFVCPAMWGQGIGKSLLTFLFSIHEELHLSVYQKNERAVNFYRRFGFVPISMGLCPHTRENEIRMKWSKIDGAPLSSDTSG